MNAPVIEYGLLLPLLIVLGGAVVGVLIEAVVARSARHRVQTVWSVLVLAAAFAATISSWRDGLVGVGAMGSLTFDGPTWFLWAMLLGFGLLALLLIADRQADAGDSAFTPMGAAPPGSLAEQGAIAERREHTEVFPLLLLSMSGMLIFPASNDFLTMFIGLEVLSFPLYLLSGLARRRRLVSQEAAMKYFLLGAMSSAIFLYGAALLYGHSGSFRFSDLDQAVSLSPQGGTLLLAGLGLVLVGLLFKVGAAPFHSWVPDVYSGAPTAITAFMAVCTKIAAVGALTRVLYVALGAARWDWQLVVAGVAVLSMVFGAVMGLTQTDVKRMLAYSSVAHAGFILVGVAGALTTVTGLGRGELGSIGATLFYLAAYGLATMGAFAIVIQVRRAGAEATSFQAWNGLARRNPLLAALMTIFLLSMAGIPLTGGFIGKIMVFLAAWRGGFEALVLIAVLASLVAAGFYLKLIWVMYFNEPAAETEVVMPGFGVWVVIGVSIIGTFVLGVDPGPLSELAAQAANFLR